jgi:hypothetical protein
MMPVGDVTYAKEEFDDVDLAFDREFREIVVAAVPYRCVVAFPSVVDIFRAVGSCGLVRACGEERVDDFRVASHGGDLDRIYRSVLHTAPLGPGGRAVVIRQVRVRAVLHEDLERA